MVELQQRRIRFKKAPATGSPADWETELRKVHGVTGINIDEGKKDVLVEYDLVECCEEAIEHKMISATPGITSGNYNS